MNQSQGEIDYYARQRRIKNGEEEMILYAPATPVDIVEIVKPKQPNFAKFQNNFKRRGNK